MKNKLSIILSVMMSSVLYSCNGSTNSDRCLASVKEKFPQAQIYSEYGSVYQFVVVDSTGVRIVRTGSAISSEITDITILIKQQ